MQVHWEGNNAQHRYRLTPGANFLLASLRCGPFMLVHNNVPLQCMVACHHFKLSLQPLGVRQVSQGKKELQDGAHAQMEMMERCTRAASTTLREQTLGDSICFNT